MNGEMTIQNTGGERKKEVSVAVASTDKLKRWINK